jgi:prepilin-type N-terminal cleavage/methylation domain-containing protein
MKPFTLPYRSSKRAGFTLVELLVVIGIIAILASVILSAGGNALKAAERAKANNLANQIQTSCIAYYTEYSVYPVPTGTATGADYFIGDTDATNWKSLIQALCGNIDPYTGTGNQTPTTPNTRAIGFLNLRPADVDVNDAPLNPLPFSTANKYFNIGLDNDYSGIVGDTGTAPTSGSLTGMPNFVKSTQNNIVPYVAGTGVTGGVVVWANCNASATNWNPAYFVRTY